MLMLIASQTFFLDQMSLGYFECRSSPIWLADFEPNSFHQQQVSMSAKTCSVRRRKWTALILLTQTLNANCAWIQHIKGKYRVWNEHNCQKKSWQQSSSDEETYSSWWSNEGKSCSEALNCSKYSAFMKINLSCTHFILSFLQQE